MSSEPDATVVPNPPVEEGGAIPEDAGVEAAALPRCSTTGFCYEDLPLQRPLVSVSATRADDVWAVGGDSILRWDGTSWRVAHQIADTSPHNNLNFFFGVWVTASDDVWALAHRPNWIEDPDRVFFVRYSSRRGEPPAFRQIDTTLLTDEGDSHRYKTTFWVSPSSDILWFLHDTRVLRFREEADGTVAMDDATPQASAEETSTYGNWIGVWGFAADDVYLGGQCLSGDDCPEGPRAALAHYDGSSWSFKVLDPAGIVTGLAGTKAGEQPRKLWIRTEDRLIRYPDAITPVSGRILLVPVSAGGGIEAPLFEKSLAWSSGCNVFSASVVGPSAAWLSNGCLLYRWDGTQLVATPFSRGNAPAGVLKGLWAESPEHVWIVGQSIPQGPEVVLNQAPEPPLPIAFPISGFAARRHEKLP